MKIGLQTAMWGARVDDLKSVLDFIAKAGYEGVEFAQRPEALGDIETLQRLLEARNLKLIGSTRGTLEERLNFYKSFRPAYLYVENWDPVINDAVKPRRFRPEI